MASAKEIRNHIESVKNTMKITDAMYMISSTKLRKAKRELDAAALISTRSKPRSSAYSASPGT